MSTDKTLLILKGAPMGNKNAAGPHREYTIAEEQEIFKPLLKTEEVKGYAHKHAGDEWQKTTGRSQYTIGYVAGKGMQHDEKLAKQQRKQLEAMQHKHAMQYILQGVAGNKYASREIMDETLARLQKHQDAWSSGSIFHGVKEQHIISVKQLRAASHLMDKYGAVFSPTLPPLRERK